MSAPILSVRGLRVAYAGKTILRDISFTLGAGETLALVGLSGCGKTTLLRAMLGLLPRSAQISGVLHMDGADCALADKDALRRRLGHQIGFVPQNPFDACSPLRKVRAHIAEAWRAHALPPDHDRIAGLCATLGLDPQMLDLYPHEWSGGMLQRATIAAAVALGPAVLIADEPTSAVDAAMADSVMACLRKSAAGAIVVSHDQALMAKTADRVMLLENGVIVSQASQAQIAAGEIPASLRAFQQIDRTPPPAPAVKPAILDVSDLTLARGGRMLMTGLHFSLRPGQVLGIAGPSGVGKSSLLAALSGILAPVVGTIRRDGRLRAPHKGEVITLFQDALSSLNPRWPLDRIVAEPLTIGRDRPRGVARDSAVTRALHAFGLGHIDPLARPGALSTGQSQRATLARASLSRARILLADEPTSALDPRQKSAALAGLARLAEDGGAAIVLVSHDRAMLRDFCHDTIVL